MSADAYPPDVYVLPEDDANRNLANGFLLEVTSPRRLRVLPAAGGWNKVLDRFESTYVGKMESRPNRIMILLIDFDGDEDRLQVVKDRIPQGLMDRVFILGAWSTPEKLRASLGPFETIGSAMAQDCRDGTDRTWGHDLLQHNAGELNRLREQVVPILFPSEQ